MDIKEIYELKQKLESELTTKIRDFEDTTLVYVYDVRLHLGQVAGKKHIILRTECDVRL